MDEGDEKKIKTCKKRKEERKSMKKNKGTKKCKE
jgi:hypothetical protein